VSASGSIVIIKPVKGMKHAAFVVGALSLAAVLQATTAHAQYRSFVTRDAAWYWWAGAGAAIPQDGHITEFGPWSSGQKLTYDVGPAVDVGFGYLFNQYVGTELQLGGSWNYVNSIEGASVHDTYFATVPILANLILQYPIPQTRLVPYIGGGVGGAGTFFDTDRFYAPVPGGSVSLHGSGADFVFAWQGRAGLRLELNDQMSVGLGYRYLHLDPSTFSFESWHHGPDLNLGFSSHESHLVAITFLMKF
jgi:opacity protein-like surface antigen